MWCQHCQQDVPALRSAEKQSLCCPRCGEQLCANQSIAPDDNDRSTYDSWEIDEQLRHIGRMLRFDIPGQEAYYKNSAPGAIERLEPPEWHISGRGKQPKPSKTVGKQEGRLGFFVGSLLAIGSACFVCGAVLLAWAWAAERQELWTIGLPIMLGGQIGLLLGLIFQLDRLWRDSREAAAKLDDVDEQLHDLKTTTTLLGTSHGPAAGAFYSHFTGGASPQLLLADLKSQLDLLALKIAQDEQ